MYMAAYTPDTVHPHSRNTDTYPCDGFENGSSQSSQYFFVDFTNGSNLSISLELEEALNCSSAHTEFPLTLCSPKVHQGKPRGEPHQWILCCLIPEKEDSLIRVRLSIRNTH